MHNNLNDAAYFFKIVRVDSSLLLRIFDFKLSKPKWFLEVENLSESRSNRKKSREVFQLCDTTGYWTV